MPNIERMMPEASDNGSQPYSCPCLMPTAFIPLRNNPYLSSCSFSFIKNTDLIRLPISISSYKQKAAIPGLEQALRIRVSNDTKF